jgi:hypothetical protein
MVCRRGGVTLVASRHSSDSGSMSDRDRPVGVRLLQRDTHQAVGGSGPYPAPEVMKAAREHRERIAAYLQNRDTLRAQGYSVTQADRLARDLLRGSSDVLLIEVKPGRSDVTISE